ncbi:LysM peptidoglycan-binding domain-containing protein [Nonomuraea sp. NPDC000554]|uniref:LysM peptidoglycan-binding domain-containing protein n=1 Tax=Nonomuraea sp. NPDC000554 TaxID=3154259 RepID=UPI00332A1829
MSQGSQGSLNPLDWDWNPLGWGWDFNPSQVLNLQPLKDTIMAIARAIPHMFDGNSELRLRAAANAHRDLGTALGKLHDAINPHVSTVLKDWHGSAGDEFRHAWQRVVAPGTREKLQKSCEGVVKVLEAVLDSTNLTKIAIIEFVRTSLIWVGLFYVMRMAANYWAALIAYLRATKIVMATVALLKRLGALFHTLGELLKAVPLVGRLRFGGKLGSIGAVIKQAALRPFNYEAISKLADPKVTTFAKYARSSAYVYGGVIATQMLGQGLQGESIFNLSPLTFTQAARITTGANLVATFMPIAGVGTKGLFQGGTAASFTATLTKTGAAVGESGMSFGGFVALRNWAIGKVGTPAWLKRFSPDMQKQLLGLAPTAAFRVWRSLNAPESYELPEWDRPVPAGSPTYHQPPPPAQWSVNEGSLWDVAAKVYGDGSRWQEIYDANRDVIGPDPSVIRVGQKLKIPKP